jgi:hypothetical protein
MIKNNNSMSPWLEETKKDLWETLRSRKESKIPSLGLTIAITKISEIIK